MAVSFLNSHELMFFLDLDIAADIVLLFESFGDT